MSFASAEERQTAGNVAAAYKDQMRANATYNAAALVADGEGEAVVAAFFRKTAEQEMTHAELLRGAAQAAKWPDAGESGAARESCTFTVHSTTEENLEAAIDGEAEDRESYLRFSEQAVEGGLADLSQLFAGLAEAENYHRALFEVLAEMASTEGLSDELGWKCKRCGWVSYEHESPAQCDVCTSGSGYFAPLSLSAMVNARL